MVHCGRPRRVEPSGDDGDQCGQLSVRRPATHHSQHRPVGRSGIPRSPLALRALALALCPLTLRALALAQSGMFPCFLGGIVSRLVCSIRSAWVT